MLSYICGTLLSPRSVDVSFLSEKFSSVCKKKIIKKIKHQKLTILLTISLISVKHYASVNKIFFIKEKVMKFLSTIINLI